MSAEVIIPRTASDIISNWLSAEVGKRPTAKISSTSVARVKRDLFGPVDKEESNKIFKHALEVQNEMSSKKWGFDFRTGQPLDNHDRYQWERVANTSAPACFTGITLIRAAHVVSQTTSTNSEDLLDQRAERENRINFNTETSPASPAGSDSEMYSCGPVRTYPLVLRSDTLTPIDAATATIKNTTNTRVSSSSSFSTSATRAQRQQRITDYLKERKRLSTGIPKVSLAKKARHMSAPACNASGSQSNTASQ
ncbi:cyclin-dependent kinase inhibitor 1B [Topomyia yanbarensis]|uniref:cyclin-dependent kinase inhibitor 1B n=1 Tax=Topomyia yanbarensis TaxID=2498891 RepID=UPI00273C0E18|nr:cyclin-dependent kinase inhibitor 1B [Topomyia yanbarensis]